MSTTCMSFVMPARNAASYIADAIRSLSRVSSRTWELIIVDDHSSDGTPEVARAAAGGDARIRVVSNTGHGKVAGLNCGFALTCGERIKCIDADDQLRPEFFNHIDTMLQCDAMCHDMCITASDLRRMGRYAMDPSFLHKDFAYCLRYLKSLPRCTWSFTRNIGDRIFPMPLELPFEDVWFSLVIKRYAARIWYVNQELYNYRQHDKQTFGGVLSFSDSVVVFRAQRMLRLLDVIESEQGRSLTEGVAADGFFEEIRRFYELLGRQDVRVRDILSCEMPASLRTKVLIYKKLGLLAPGMVRLKWLLDRVR